MLLYVFVGNWSRFNQILRCNWSCLSTLWVKRFSTQHGWSETIRSNFDWRCVMTNKLKCLLKHQNFSFYGWQIQILNHKKRKVLIRPEVISSLHFNTLRTFSNQVSPVGSISVLRSIIRSKKNLFIYFLTWFRWVDKRFQNYDWIKQDLPFYWERKKKKTRN